MWSPIAPPAAKLPSFAKAVEGVCWEGFMIELTVRDAGARLDAYIAEVLDGLSRAQAHRWIEEGAVTVNGRITKTSYKVQEGDELQVTPPAIKPTTLVPEAIPLDIVFEDEDLLVVNKPKGMVVHPAPGAEEGTLVHALLAHAPGMLSVIGGQERPGIVHRLDKGTSGLLMIAKNDVTHRALQAQIQSREAKRTYLALLWGQPPYDEAVIEAPIGRQINCVKEAILYKESLTVPTRAVPVHQ